MPRNDPNKVLRTSTDATVNARDYRMVLADATAGAIALVLISPAGLSEWAIKVANVGSGSDVTLSVAGGGSFSLALPAGAAAIIEQDDLGVLHVFGSTTAGTSIGGLSHISGTLTDVAVDTPDGATVIGDVGSSGGETTLAVDDLAGTVEIAASNGLFINGQEVDPSNREIPAGESVTYSADAFAGIGSYQPVSIDLELDPAAGSDTPTNPKFLSPVMGNLSGGVALTNQANYLAGLIGANSDDCSASDYPTAGVIGLLFDGAQADSIVLADLDGDDGGAPTNARAAFGVSVNNNNASSGCDYGLSLFAAPNTNYGGTPIGFVPANGDIEFSNGVRWRALTVAVTANSTTTSDPAGTFACTSNATGRGSIFRSDGSKWQFLINS